ncbi:MAG: hypothetical protein HF300_07700 [Ignavibacteria bacterium]|jgi:hypothetical protein|nr:hypothetical protein [Ignavibacteria bacterium]
MPKQIKKIVRKYPYHAVFLSAVIAWLPAVFIPFINDDYQILGYHAGKGWISILRPFYTPDVSNFYWRPLGNVLHPLILLTAGFHPMVFRVASLLLYALCCLFVAKAGEKAGLSKTYSALGAILFAVLPSHEYQAAWIADQGESLVTIMLLAAFCTYADVLGKESSGRRNVILFYVLLLLSALIKESAFAGVLIPVIALIAGRDLKKRKTVTALRDTLAGIVIIACILLYRWYFIGGTPFSSNHFAHSGIFRWVQNFIIYIPLSFFSPESLELLASTSRVLLALASAGVLIAFYIIFIYRKPLRTDRHLIWTLIASLAWFTVFILPGLPTLMRWYVFTASIGLVWAAAAAGENIKAGSFSKKASLVLFLLVILSSSVYDFSLMLRWGSVGKRMDHALMSLSGVKDEIKTDTVYVWATPDKLTRIPMMKLGIQESVQWGLKDKNAAVITPLRSEMSGFESSIKLVEKTDTSLVFHINNGRFLPYGGESRAAIHNEAIDAESEGVRIRIKTFLGEDNVPQSIAGVYFRNSRGYSQLYFDGKEFKNAGK